MFAECAFCCFVFDAVAAGRAQVCKTEVGGSNPPSITLEKSAYFGEEQSSKTGDGFNMKTENKGMQFIFVYMNEKVNSSK